MMTIYDEARALLLQLSTYDKVRLLEDLSEALRQELAEEFYRRMPYDEFIERTAGSLANDPVQRWPQGDFEDREPIE